MIFNSTLLLNYLSFQHYMQDPSVFDSGILFNKPSKIHLVPVSKPHILSWLRAVGVYLWKRTDPEDLSGNVGDPVLLQRVAFGVLHQICDGTGSTKLHHQLVERTGDAENDCGRVHTHRITQTHIIILPSARGARLVNTTFKAFKVSGNRESRKANEKKATAVSGNRKQQG